MIILGLGGLLADAAAAVLKDGELIAAIEESKLTRGIAPAPLPQAAIAECLSIAKAQPAEVDCVAIARPFSRGPESRLHLELRDQFSNAEIVVVEHHVAHAASAFFASPFEQATVLTLDHAGDFRCGARWHANGTELHLEKEWYYPDSLGRLYRAVTQLLGYRPGADEHKVQWLSTSGDQSLAPLFRELLSDSARLDPTFFDASGALGPKFFDRLTAREFSQTALAAGLQRTIEETVLTLAGEGENLAL